MVVVEVVVVVVVVVGAIVDVVVDVDESGRTGKGLEVTSKSRKL